MRLLYGFESAPGDLFLRDKVGNTAAGGGIAIGSNCNTSQSRSSSSDGVDGMDAIRVPKQFIKSRNDWTCMY